MPTGRFIRLALLSVVLFFFFKSSILFAQVIDPQKIRTLPGPVSDQVCTLTNTHIDAYHYVRYEDLTGEFRPLQLDTEFEVTYVNACGQNEWPEDAIEAFEHAAEIWAMHLDSSIPIRVEAFWENISPLGQASPTFIIHSNAIPNSEDDTWYTVAQANAMTGIDFLATENEEFDMVIRLNCNVANWYFGTDANPGSGQLDFVTVALHEIGHGIGFLGTVVGNAGNQTAEWGIEFQGELTPLIYDRFPEDGDEISILDENVYPNPSNDLYQAVVGTRGGLLFNGPESADVRAGEPVPLYAPVPWQPGSSYAHVDQATFTGTENALMRPQIDQAFAQHTPGPVFCGMLSDWGWPLGSGCQAILERDVFIEITADSLDFQFVNIGDTRELSFLISNDVTTSDTLEGSVEISGQEFSLLEGEGSFSLEPGASREIRVIYEPRRVGVSEGVLSVSHNAFNILSPVEIGLTGEGLERDVLAQLEQNFPNPFHAGIQGTQINYGLPQDGRVRVDLFDSVGRHVKTLVDEHQSAGRYEMILDVADLASGVYIYRIIVDNFVESKKMTLIR